MVSLRIPSGAELAVLAIRWYQRWVAPHLVSRVCRFTPSCSDYAIAAIDKYGLVRGGLLAWSRFRRCRPSEPGGYDPLR